MPTITCVSQPARDLLSRSGLLSTAELQVLEQISDCERGNLGFTGKGKSGRARSAYQEFVSSCMKEKHIKGFGEAPKAMKACAAEWKARKGK